MASEYIADASCSFCDSRRVSLIMDFGDVALAGAFVTKDQIPTEQRYPMRLGFCQDCYAVQVIEKIPPEILFKDYFYFSSSIGTLCDHFVEYAKDMTDRFLDPSSATVLEFGCNDGVLLIPFAEQGNKTVIGVDPATNVVASIDDPRVTIINDFFNEKSAAAIVEKYGHIDLIAANNVYAHIADIQGITRAIEGALDDEGVFVFEVHYLGKLINEMQYDMIYHEHLYYYSLLSAIEHFKRYNMVVFDVKPVPIHAGSMRFYVCKDGSTHSKEITQAVVELAQEERREGFEKLERFAEYANQVAGTKSELVALLDKLRDQGKSIAGYGASGRANTVIQYCGISEQHLDYMIDDAPAKQGFYTPGSHFEIKSSAILLEDDRPDYLVLFAWSFLNEIAGRNSEYIAKGGKMILPLPHVSIYPD